MQFDGFDWDEGNLDKCRKHGVTVAEVEGVFTRAVTIAPDHAHSTRERRFIAIGRTEAERWVFLVFTWRRRDKRHLIRPTSARFMHAREISRYEEMPRPDE